MSRRMVDEASVYMAERRAGVYDDDVCEFCGSCCECGLEDEFYDAWRDREYDEF